MSQLDHYADFIRAGYTLQELVPAFIRLKILSPIWTRVKYPLRRRGARVCIDWTADLSGVRHIEIDDDSWVQRDVWLTVPLIAIPHVEDRVYLSLGKRVHVGRNAFIGAAHSIRVDDDVLMGPGVTITDHNHRFDDPTRLINQQGVTEGGFVHVGRGCFIGAGAVIVGHRGLTIGDHAVIGANAVVTKDVPPYGVVAGNPAQLIGRRDATSRTRELSVDSGSTDVAAARG